ncbi:MAG: DUF6075 family protein [Lachnospiraceae bacterium]|nr:DUF6075 family protein [Lachnospiraceae bacterium]
MKNLDAMPKDHFDAWRTMCIMDGTQENDRERQTLFFIIAGNRELRSHTGQIYDFERHSVKILKDPDLFTCFSSSAVSLLKLAIHLYNGAYPTELSPVTLFWGLDDRNIQLVLCALAFHFKKEMVFL